MVYQIKENSIKNLNTIFSLGNSRIDTPGQKINHNFEKKNSKNQCQVTDKGNFNLNPNVE